MRLLVVSMIAVGCSDDITAVELVVTVAPNVEIDHYQVALGERVVVTDLESSLRLVLPDDVESAPMLVTMWGLRDGQQAAFGTVEVTPRANEVVRAEVLLLPALCTVDGCCTARRFVDADGDGHGDPTRSVVSCDPHSGHVASDDDCDDANRWRYPSATETCDGIDNDCMPDTTESCPPSCEIRTYDDHLYLICSTSSTWHEARAVCQSQGYELAQIDSEAENAWLLTQSPGTPSQNHLFHIGANDLAIEGRWDWSGGPAFWSGAATGSPVEGRFSKWLPGEPNSYTGDEDCAMFRTDGAWIDGRCSWTAWFACERS